MGDLTEILLQELKDVFHTEGDSISFKGNSLAMLITEIEKLKAQQEVIDKLEPVVEAAWILRNRIIKRDDRVKRHTDYMLFDKALSSIGEDDEV